MSPTYDYLCMSCGHGFEKFQTMSAKPLSVCPECDKKKLVRLIGAGAPLVVSKERLSKSMAVHPHQVAQAMAAFPGSRYAPPDKSGLCQLIIGSRKEKLARLKQRGLTEVEPNDIEQMVDKEEARQQIVLDRIKRRQNECVV